MRKLFGRIGERAAEGLFALCGSMTSIMILLIVVFLFREGLGLFRSPEIENGYALCIHASNPVERLSPQSVKSVFDGEITDWQELGGKNGEIMPFRFDEIFSLYSEEELGADYSLLSVKLGEVIERNRGIIAFLPEQYLPSNNMSVRILPVENIAPSDFFGGTEWMPTVTPAPQFGVIPLVLGTLLVSIFAILIALPPGLGVAIYMSELADERVRKLLKPAIELLAGIPSVVYGFFGLAVIVPLIRKILHLPVGETALAGSLILAVMALPTIITIAEDAMRNTPKAMREASLALGATHWQTIYRVIIPYAASGISAAVVLGIGRAIGETMAVLMVTGNAAVIPHSLFESVRTIPATIAAELGEAPSGGTHYRSLFLLGCILFVITLTVSVSAEIISKKRHDSGQ
ncbi:MAG: phosphate ABC transporter permease subunit PstC [Prevotellaceae bacterium]|jgi:phosphate transport system permease protein|nr:phosphate ABC transporter permease subunit PstC [Prevotellaceae bacterium]